MKKLLLSFVALLLCVSFSRAAEYSVYFDNSTAKWSSVYIYGYNWSDGEHFGGWEGTKVTETTAEGYYKVTVTADADPTGSGAKIIFNNGSGTQTDNLDWVTNAIYNNGGPTGSLYGGGEVELTEYKVYFDNSLSSWDPVKVYGWGGLDVGESWPGLTLTETTSEGYYVYTYKGTSSPAGAGLQFNNGGDSGKTKDLVWVDNAIYNKDGNTGNLYGGGTVEIDMPEKLYIRGAMNNWLTTAMTKVDNTFTWRGTLSNGAEFKFDETGDWGTQYTTESDVNVGTEYTLKGGMGNCKWVGADNSEVIITVKFSISATTMTIEEVPGELTYTVTVPANTPACFIAGEMNEWESFIEMTKVDATTFTITFDNVTKSMGYKYASGADWAYVEKDASGNEIGDRTWTANDVVAKWAKVYNFPADITSGANYFLIPNEDWTNAAGTYYAKFINKNDGTYAWVQGSETEKQGDDAIVFYLAAGNLPQSAVTRSGEGATYTHVVFFKSTTEYASLSDADITAATCKTDELVLNPNEAYEVEGGSGSISTGIENVEVADGITYAYGVVEAEGAIEVYSINGAVVARGNDNVDLRDLNRGIYIVRNGDQVRKVVR